MKGTGISVVIPLYNKGAFIRRALNSVMAQDVQPDEVIVVDDGSSDGGSEVVLAFEGLPIRLIRQDNAGVSVARNRGVQEARCDWVAFLDADDEYLPGAVRNFRDARDRYPRANVVFGRSVTGGSLTNPAPLERRYQWVHDYFAYLLTRKAHEADSSSVMVHKCAIEAVGLFPPGIRIGEDTDTWMRLGCRYPFVRIDAPISIYHIADGSSGWEGQRSELPYWFGTYARWRDGGRIPVERRRSAARYFEFCRLQRVIFLARTRPRVAVFRALLANVSWMRAPKVMLAKTFLIALWPPILRNAG